MQDAWRAYLELAMGLTEASRRKAQTVVRRVVGQGGATATQLQSLAEELLSTGLANREALTKLVRFEVDRALGAVGLATADEVSQLTARVRELERELRSARGSGTAPAASVSTVQAAAPDLVTKRTAAKKVAAKKVAAKKAAPGTAVRKAGAGKAVETAPGEKRLDAKKLPPPARKITGGRPPTA